MYQIQKTQTQTNQSQFEYLKRIEDGQEYWLGRELQEALGYTRWEKFKRVIESVFNEIEFETGNFHQAGKIYFESGRTKKRENAQLTRLACYKIAMRGETQECIQARTYFATQTRKQELQSSPYENLKPSQLIGLMEMSIQSLKNQNQRIEQLETRIEEVANQKALVNVIEVRTAKDFKTLKKDKEDEVGREINALVREKFIIPVYGEINHKTNGEISAIFQHAHRAARRSYYELTGITYLGAKRSSFQSKVEFLEWLKKVKV